MNGQLLSLSDLPPGWSIDNTPDSNNSSTPKCFKNAKSTVSTDKAKGEAKFQDGSNGVPFLEEDIVYQPGQAQQTMAEFSKVMGGCGQISISDSGHTFTGTIGAMSFPSLGQQTEPYQVNLSGTVDGLNVTLGLDLIAIRVNDEIAIIFYGDLGTPDVAQVQGFAQKAVSKMTSA